MSDSIDCSILTRTGLVLVSVLCTACPPKHDHGDMTSTEGSETGTATGSTTVSEETEASTAAGEDMGGDAETTDGVEGCVPPLDALIEVRLRRCSSEACDGLDLDSWAPPGSETGTLVAACSVVGPPIVFEPPTRKRWILEGCTGDSIPMDGRLALDWGTDPVVEPSLPPSAPVNIELRRPRVGAHALSIRDARDGLIALEVASFEPPSAAFSAPVTIEIATTLCEVPPVSCLGPRRIHELRFDDGAGNAVQLGWGAYATLGEDPRHQILLRQAQSWPDIPCGEFSEGGFFDLVVAR